MALGFAELAATLLRNPVLVITQSDNVISESSGHEHQRLCLESPSICG
jgi:hypothetical protein